MHVVGLFQYLNSCLNVHVCVLGCISLPVHSMGVYVCLFRVFSVCYQMGMTPGQSERTYGDVALFWHDANMSKL